MKLYGMYAAALAAVFIVAGCNSGGSSDNGTSSNATTGTSGSGGSGGKKALEIAVIPKGSTHEYWKSIHEGANEAAQELGNVTIDFKGPEKEDDKDGQIKVVENFVQTKVDGIVLAPLDATALGPAAKEAQDASIPVVIIDSTLNNFTPVSYVATDNQKAGKLGGEELAKELGGKGNVIMLRYEEGSASTEQREAGFEDAMKENPNIKIISDNQHAGATEETAQKASENLIQEFTKDGKFQADGIFCPNESSAFGMLRALQDANLAGKLKFVGFDSSDPLVAGLKSGQINGLVVQNPVKMGHDGVTNLVKSIRGEKVDDKEDTGATVVTKANMDQPDVAKLIAPPKA
jgi:ribose transport system substrate-binding protein